MKFRRNLEEFNETTDLCRDTGLIRLDRSCSSTISTNNYEGTASAAPAETGRDTESSGEGGSVLPTTAGRGRAWCCSRRPDNNQIATECLRLEWRSLVD